ncbi:MAG: YifB family Mg chelatase-like AAA ATPase [Nocardioides sp.]|nr:YifB family Mg chelatase-like AAA ATPase [Nocardioides sp.]
MSFATARTIVLRGAEGHLVDVQADVSPGVVGVTMTGRVDKSVTEAAHRVRMAINNSRGRWPATKRVTVLVAPADLPKSGTHLDLAIALAIMAADRDEAALTPEALGDHVFIGELAVDGALRPVHGVLPMVIAAARRGFTRVVVPEPHAAEAALVPGVSVFGLRSLDQVIAHLIGVEVPEAEPVADLSAIRLGTWRGEGRLADVDMAELDGLDEVRFAVEVAAAGGHPMMMIGPRGVGKTSIAERIPTILPDLTVEESLEVSALHSVAGLLADSGGLVRRPPWFAPHHGASAVSVLGGGNGRVRPGQVSLAHHGVLFLDEFVHFRSDVVEALREPLESGEVTISRGEEHATFPARSLVVLAANPCPCGNFFGTGTACDCSALMRQQYTRKLSGPIVDRVDIWMEVRPEPARRFPSASGEDSATVRERVSAARARQARRYAGCRWHLNSAAPGPVLAERWPLPREGQALIDSELAAGVLSRRGVTRVHRLAWSVADVLGLDVPGEREVQAALVLRSSDSSRSLATDLVRAWAS